MIGKTIAHYKILEKLGEGGMGVVYKARDTKLDRIVALKFLPAELTQDLEAKERFIQEARAAAALNHPNIVTIYEISETDGQSFIAMELVEGQSLEEKIRQAKTSGGAGLRADELIGIAAQICEGLEKAHRAGIVHRDVKPGNILLDRDGRVKILDFGLAKLRGVSKLTKEASTLGTAQYMSPEQIQGEEVDHRTDIWSLGCVLYEMATGRPPFRGDYEQAVLYSILNQEPDPVTSLRADAPDVIDRIITRALAKEPENRFASAGEMLNELEPHTLHTSSVRPFPAEKQRPAHGKKWYALGVAAGIVLILIALAARFVFFQPSAEAMDSLAVLPLENLSGDPEQEYFVDGMTEALITELSKIRALRVISRTSVMRYKNTDKALPKIARELNVDAIVEGSAMRAGDRIRITAQLIHADTDRHLWAESYDRELRDVLVLQKEVAQAIAREVRVTLTPEEEKQLARARPVDPRVHEAYLRGLFHNNQLTIEGANRALEYFEEAAEIDPQFALAYVGQADAYDHLSSLGGMSPWEGWPRVKAQAERALEIDESLAHAHILLADVKYLHEWDWEGADESFRRGIELDPGDATARAWYALLLSAMGRHEEAIHQATQAVQLDPLSITAWVNAAAAFRFAGLFDRALEPARKAVEVDPNSGIAHITLGNAYLHKAMFDRAIAEFHQAQGLLGESAASPSFSIALTYAMSGEKDKAEALLEELLAHSEDRYMSPMPIAAIYNALGEKDRALDWLEKAYKERSTHLPLLGLYPELHALRSEPRFQDLLRKMNLPLPESPNRGGGEPATGRTDQP